MLASVSRRVLAVLCSRLIELTGHRICCRIPEWTARVGQRWRPFDEAPYNLFNIWWRFGQWIVLRAEADG